MKEFAMKHPFITWLIADSAFVCIQNCVMAITDSIPVRTNFAHEVIKDTCDMVNDMAEKEKEASKEDENDIDEMLK